VELVIERLVPEALERIRPFAKRVVVQGEQVMVVLASQQDVNHAIDVVRSVKGHVVSLTPHRASLEDLFIREAKSTKQPVEAAA
jgi:ABC-2 type transport system ATP-binding protein